jgi:hypothetical protein
MAESEDHYIHIQERRRDFAVVSGTSDENERNLLAGKFQ